MTDLEMRNLPDHHPQSDDQVLRWLKHFYDNEVSGEDEANIVQALINEYEATARKGWSLEETVNGPHLLPMSTQLKKKKKLNPGTTKPAGTYHTIEDGD